MAMLRSRSLKGVLKKQLTCTCQRYVRSATYHEPSWKYTLWTSRGMVSLNYICEETVMNIDEKLCIFASFSANFLGIVDFRSTDTLFWMLFSLCCCVLPFMNLLLFSFRLRRNGHEVFWKSKIILLPPGGLNRKQMTYMRVFRKSVVNFDLIGIWLFGNFSSFDR